MKMYKHVCKLSNMKRFAALKLDREYSVAEHSYRVAMMSMMVVDEYNHLVETGVVKGNKINTEEVLKKSLIHDLDEIVLGADVPTPVKQYPGFRDLLRQVSIKLLKEQVFDECLPKKDEYLRLWEQDKDGESGQVIIICDKLEALLTAAYELKRGNKDLQKAFNNIREWFKTEEALFLLEKFPVTKSLLQTADEMPIVQESFKLIS